jgi:hypothetical protein
MYRIHWMHFSKESFSSKTFTSREESKAYAEAMAARQPKRYSFYEVFEVR